MTPHPARRFAPASGTGLSGGDPEDAARRTGTDGPGTTAHTTDERAATGGPWQPGRPWRNWGRSQVAHPLAVARPADTAELHDVLAAARDRGLSVKPVGAGHSFTGIAVAPGVQLDLTRLAGVVEVDTARSQVTLGAGTRLHDVPALLAPYGLAMENLGDIDRQTLAGATSTGTHGTGAGYRGLAAQIRRVRLVTPDGRDVTVSPTENSRWWGAAQLGLGALGVLTEVTLACVPAFALHAVETPAPLGEVLDAWDERCAAADHFEFYWFPGTDLAATKTNTRLPADTPLRPRGTATRWIDDTLVANGVYRGICALGSRVHRIVPVTNQVGARFMARREYVEPSHDVFVTSRTVRFREMEYALPLDAVPDALRDLDALIRRQDLRISFPVEVRCAAADDLWLSTAAGRPTGYVAVHQYYREDYRRYLGAAQAIFRAYGGRPHWGKLHSLHADELADLYPRFTDFLAARDALDPERALSNPYLERVLGR